MVYAIVGGVLLLIVIFSLQAQAKEITIDFDNLIKLKADKYDIDFFLAKAVVKTESNFNAKAKNPSDPSYGLAQITPAIARDYGFIKSETGPITAKEEAIIMDPGNNIDMECHFLSDLLKHLSWDGAIQAYNVGYRGYLIGRRNFDYLSKVRAYYDVYIKEGY